VPPLEDYGRLPAFDHLCISPSGQRIAHVATIEGRRRVIARDAKPGSAPLLQLGIDHVKLRWLYWLDDNLVLGATSSTQELGLAYTYELSHLFVAQCDSGRVFWPLQQRRRVDAFLGYYGTRQRSGRWKAFVGSLRLERDGQGVGYLNSGVELIELDLLSGDTRLIAGAHQDNAGWALDQQGELMAYARRDGHEQRWSLFRAGESQPLLSVNDPQGYCFVHGLGRDPHSVLCWLPDEQRSVWPHEVRLRPQADATPVPLPPEQHRVSLVLHDVRTHLLAGLMLDQPLPWPRMFDPAQQARIDGVRRSLPGATLSFSSASANFEQITFHSQAADDAGTWWLADVTRGAADEVGWSYPSVRARQVMPWRVVKHAASDGLQIEGVLTLPPGERSPACAKGLPLIVLPHGGPVAHDVPAFDWWAQALASRGYAVWQPNFRGSSGYGAAFQRAGHGQWGRRMQTDLSDGIEALAAQGIVDRKRACIVGASYGGYAALAGVTLQQGLYRCAVSVAGVTDLEEFMTRTSQRHGPAARRYVQTLIGHDLSERDALRALSPLAQAARADAPVLLVHGVDDTVTPPLYSRLMARALRNAGKAVETVELDGEDHYLSRETTRIAMLRVVVDFVQRHNPVC
jgi:pimeloyl-ACP methyl ester carboxylesterase